MMKINDDLCGKYSHYKTGKIYQVLGVALHSETCEEMVIYRALYNCTEFGNNQVWVRPKTMFIEQVIHGGDKVPRFKRIDAV